MSEEATITLQVTVREARYLTSALSVYKRHTSGDVNVAREATLESLSERILIARAKV